ADAAGPHGAAAPRELGERLERGAGAAEMIDQEAERARPDVVAADEAQPVEPLLVAQANDFTPGHRAAPSLHTACRKADAARAQPGARQGSRTDWNHGQMTSCFETPASRAPEG